MPLDTGLCMLLAYSMDYDCTLRTAILCVQVLRRGELASVFTAARGWQVVEDSERRLPDNRPLNCFLARRVRSVKEPHNDA
jgi:hypothetical protein